MRSIRNQIQMDNPNNPNLVGLSLPSNKEMTEVLENILDDCETTVGYEDNSHIVPINAISVSEAVPHIIAYIRKIAWVANR